MKRIKLVVVLIFFGWFSLFAQDKKFITYKVKEGESIQSIAKTLAITPYDLLKLNPDIQGDVAENDILIIPNKQYDPLLDISNADLTGISDRDIIVDKFVYHEVIPKETLFSLSKNYNVSTDELKEFNPFLSESGLKIGQVIKIPLQVDDTELLSKEENLQPYLVKPKETKFSIAKKFGITIGYLEELNPRIEKDGLQIDDVILVPAEVQESGDDGYLVYEVQKLETLYSLTKKFEISEEDLVELNPEIRQGIKAGMLIRIPDLLAGSKPMFIDVIPEDRELKVAMMLPFKSKRDSLNFENDRLLNITTDFYFGALIAIDSLKKQGLSVHMKVFDTENNRQISKQISNQVELQEFDALVGPLFLTNVREVSDNLKYGKPLIVSPISTRDHSDIQNSKLVQDKASIENHITKMLDYVKRKYENQDLIVIRNSSERSEIQYNRIIDELKALNPEKEVLTLSPEDGYIKPDDFKVFRDTLDRDIVNWFFVTDNDPAYLGDVFNNLGVFPEADSLMVFGFEKDRNFNKIDNNFLARVNFHYPSNSFIDPNNSAAYRNFEAVYRRKYYTLPSSYAVEGFDVTYDLLMRLASDPDFVNQGRSERIATRYDYIENTSGSIINNGIYIIKYDGLEQKVISEEITPLDP
ncbi:LysM peptidoglycan-binding domain-containing protein [Lutimonas saemankumensis]|uniref:LysM peptidoglycan-binding domain-containing protein n=1 Tax=Lutimonas saemankumensis TaxID=483016 RepID=UPI001CD4596B|nr:LysM peptidoglycan-binding domain-containing protein [Lutimonas saemankumensis]MCA0932238.1 LysM peptidoglycan-binding domain-containing protein [Lutimonas saemankumensis]